MFACSTICDFRRSVPWSSFSRLSSLVPQVSSFTSAILVLTTSSPAALQPFPDNKPFLCTGLIGRSVDPFDGLLTRKHANKKQTGFTKFRLTFRLVNPSQIWALFQSLVFKVHLLSLNLEAHYKPTKTRTEAHNNPCLWIGVSSWCSSSMSWPPTLCYLECMRLGRGNESFHQSSATRANATWERYRRCSLSFKWLVDGCQNKAKTPQLRAGKPIPTSAVFTFHSFFP